MVAVAVPAREIIWGWESDRRWFGAPLDGKFLPDARMQIFKHSNTHVTLYAFQCSLVTRLILDQLNSSINHHKMDPPPSPPPAVICSSLSKLPLDAAIGFGDKGEAIAVSIGSLRIKAATAEAVKNAVWRGAIAWLKCVLFVSSRGAWY